MRSMLLEGHVVGNISVEKLALKGNAFVFGDITCQSITVEPSARIVGRVNIHSAAPKTLDADGNIVSEKENVTEV
jgi:cytoskeletal protein CcmA (bactofilin family)